MTDINRLKQLFNYDRWANRRVARALDGAPLNSESEAVRLMAHIGASQQIWYRRIMGGSTDAIELWPGDQPIQAVVKQLEEMHRAWRELLDGPSFDAARTISYRNTKGIPFDTTAGGILHHLIIHGQHHRAQAATLLRQGGSTPPATDFIFYLRENGH